MRPGLLAGLPLVAIVAIVVLLVGALSAAGTRAEPLAENLQNPRGLAIGPDGALYVAEAGGGGNLGIRAGIYQVPSRIGKTARVSRVTAEGRVEPYVTDLPSIRLPDEVWGATGVAWIGNELFVLTGAGGRTLNDPTFDNAVVRVRPDRSTSVLANLTAYNVSEPALSRREDPRADVEGGVPFGLAALGDRLYVTDGNHETITEVTLDGKLRRLVELPESNRVLVGIAAGPDGALYVAEYGPFPQVEGSARVSRAGLDGSYVPAEMGLTTAIALAFDPLGVLHVVEFSSGRRQSNTGRLVRRLPDGKTQVVVGGLSFPTGIAIAPDGTIYVSDRGHVSEGGSGRVVRIRPPGAIDRIADGLRSRFGWLFGSG